MPVLLTFFDAPDGQEALKLMQKVKVKYGDLRLEYAGDERTEFF